MLPEIFFSGEGKGLPKTHDGAPPVSGQGSPRLPVRGRSAVIDHLAVLQADDPLGLDRDGVVMGDEYHGVALPVQVLRAFPVPPGLVWESRAPVGSSARMTAGVPRQRPGDGHPLLLSAGELIRDGGEIYRSGPRCSSTSMARCRRSALRNAGVHQRHLHVFQQRQLRQQIVLLEDEAQHVCCGSLPAGLCSAGPHPVRPAGMCPSAGHVQAADDVHAGGFSGAGLADDGHKFPPVDLHGNMICRHNHAVAHVVDFGDLTGIR